MGMTLKDLDTLPAALPIPQLDGLFHCQLCRISTLINLSTHHIIGRRQDEGLRRVDTYRANVVRMRLEAGDLLGGVVVVDTKLEVIGAANDPVLARNEATGADGDIGELESLDNCLRSLSDVYQSYAVVILTCVS